MAQTTTADLIQPEVFADVLAAEFPNAIKMAPLAVVDTTLEGKPGDKITRPEWARLSDATELAETDVIVPQKLTQSSDSVVIKEAGLGVEFTDKAVLQSLGDPLGEGRRQIVLAIGNKIDADLYAAAAAGVTGPHLVDSATFDLASATAAIEAFGEMQGDPADVFAGFVISPAQHMNLVRSGELLTRDKAGDAATLFRGAVGSYLGVPVVVSNRASAGALLIEKGALVLGYQRRPLVETDRDILARSTVVTANVHFAAFKARQKGVAVIRDVA